MLYRYSLKKENEVMNGTIEMDESYFGPTRVKGKRGRGVGGKIKVFGLLKRKGKVYTHIVDDVKASTLLGELQRKGVCKGKITYKLNRKFSKLL